MIRPMMDEQQVVDRVVFVAYLAAAVAAVAAVLGWWHR
jgi:hypothetical protein